MDRETAESLEVSARYENGRIRFELNLFHIDFADYIALVERGDVWWLDEDTDTSGFAADEAAAPAGADEVLPVFAFAQQDARFTGGEIFVSAHLFDAGAFTVRGDAALDIVSAAFRGGGHPPRIPPATLTLGLEGESENWTGRIELVDTAAQRRLAPFETATDSFAFLNASLAWRPNGPGGAWSLRLDGRNLTDDVGRVHSSFLKDELPLPGRSVRLTLLADF